MAQSIQIAPKYTFPHVETVINDYTVVTDTADEAISADSVVRYIFPFVSSKGIDNKFIKKRTRSNIVAAYGETNWKKFGQPLMQALHVAEAANSEVWCMRVMPDDATYAHNIISAYYKADEATDVDSVANCKFRIKYVQKSITDANKIKTVKDILAEAATIDGTGDDNGYVQIPGVVTMYSTGRGKYGNNYSVRIGQDIYYEKDYGIKYYDFEIISNESGAVKEATYIGSHVTSTKYNTATFITDILEDADDGMVPVFINVDEAGIEDLYNAYVDWAQGLIDMLNDELATATDDDAKAKINALIDDITKNIPEIDAFDPFYGRKIASTTVNPYIEFVTSGDANVISWDSMNGVKLAGGNDGAFDASNSEESINAAIEKCYVNAFSGVYDKRVLSAKRVKVNALWDANYSMTVKNAMADLATLRNDTLCYFDCGILESFAGDAVKGLIQDYEGFTSNIFSKNVQHYYVKESTTKKRIPVTITYFLARQYADHVMNYGQHVPFVKSYAQLTGHIKDSLAPAIEDYNTDLKEMLTDNRFNFFETVDDNVFQRATQNTAQESTSDLLEENNVATLYEMKRIIETDIIDNLYDFSNAETRERFRNYERAKFASWSGREVESFDIDFRMSAWESERSILHAYLNVTFRGLQKRAILEIDINKRNAVGAVYEG